MPRPSWRSIAGIALLLSAALLIHLGAGARGYQVSKIENDVYGSFVKSALDDGDLNIINQVEPRMRWLVTKTLNHPDIREHGALTLWLPFYAYRRVLSRFGVAMAPARDDPDELAQALGTAFMVGLLMAFALGMLRLGDPGCGRLALALSFLGTPLLWYCLIDPSGTDIPSALMVTLAIAFGMNLSGRERSSDRVGWFLFGAILGLCSAVKVHAAFYMALPLGLSLRRHLGWRDRQERARLMSLLAGVGLVLAFGATNRYIQWGFIRNPYFFMESDNFRFFRSAFNWDLLVGRDGFFYISPIYVLSMAGGILFMRDTLKLRGQSGTSGAARLIPLSAIGIMALSMTLTLFRPFPNEELGGRQFIAQEFVFLFMLHQLLVKTRRTKGFAVVVVACVAAVLWNLMHAVRYFNDPDDFMYHYLSGATEFSLALARMRNQTGAALASLGDSILAVVPWLPCIVACAWIIQSISRAGKITGAKMYRILAVGSLFLLCEYGAVTLSNALRNTRNTRQMAAAGYFKDSVVGGGLNVYLYDDILSILPKMSRIAEVKGDTAYASSVSLYREDYLKRVANEVLVDPIGFKADLMRGKVRPSFWDMK